MTEDIHITIRDADVSRDETLDGPDGEVPLADDLDETLYRRIVEGLGIDVADLHVSIGGGPVLFPPDELERYEADDRGRVNLGADDAAEQVRVAVFEPPADGQPAGTREALVASLVLQADHRGRVSIGTEYAGETVFVGVRRGEP